MIYVYPKLSDHDYNLFRTSSLGLGNMMFPFARALIFARDHDAELIWPTWNTIPVGQIIRGEKPKRFYNDIFCNREGYIDGLQKINLLLKKEHVTELWGREHPNELNDKIVVFEGMDEDPENTLEDRMYVRTRIEANLHEKSKKALNFTPGDAICVHVRLGDFQRATEQQLLQGMHNASIPLEWYQRMIEWIRTKENKPEKRVYIFSDGTDDELKLLLSDPFTEKKTYGTALGDILAMSKAEWFIASRSSFSMWVSYLGLADMHTICYPGPEGN